MMMMHVCVFMHILYICSHNENEIAMIINLLPVNSHVPQDSKIPNCNRVGASAKALSWAEQSCLIGAGIFIFASVQNPHHALPMLPAYLAEEFGVGFGL